MKTSLTASRGKHEALAEWENVVARKPHDGLVRIKLALWRLRLGTPQNRVAMILRNVLLHRLRTIDIFRHHLRLDCADEIGQN